MLAHHGNWVLIEQLYLTADQRQSHLPEETKQKDFMLRVKGFLLDEECAIGSVCTIRTKTGRIIEGKLLDIFVAFDHSFGDYVQETEYIEPSVKAIFDGGLNE